MRRFRGLGIVPLAVLLSVAPAAAQTFGIRAGGTSSSASFETQQDLTATSRSGPAFAVFFDVDTDDFISFQTEVGYQGKGFGFQGETTGEVVLDYLTLDGLFKLGAPLGIVRLGGLAGIGMAGATKCEIDGQKCKDAGADVNTLDFSATIGAEAALLLGDLWSIWGDVRYAVGLSNINKTDEVFTDLKNKAWVFTVGVGFAM